MKRRIVFIIFLIPLLVLATPFVFKTSAVNSLLPSQAATSFYRSGTLDGSRYEIVNGDTLEACDFDVYFTLKSSISGASSFWTTYQHDSRHSGLSPFLGPQTSNATVLYDFGSGFNGSSSPVVGANGLIYFVKQVNAGGFRVTALASDGSIVFESPQYSAGNLSALLTVADDGTIYVAAGAGNQTTYLHALFPNGSLKWMRTFSGFTNPVSLGHDGTIYVASGFWQTAPDLLTALNPDGTTKWTYDFGSVNAIQSAAIAPNGNVIVSDNGNNFVEAHDPANGNRLWQTFLGTEPGTVSPTAIAADGTIYVFYNRLWAISSAGKVLWTTPFMSPVLGSTPAISADGSVVFATSDYSSSGLAKLFSYSASGQMQWSANLSQDLGFSNPQVALDAEGAAYVRFDKGNNSLSPLFAVNSNGSVRWNYPTVFPGDIVIGFPGKALLLVYDQSWKIISLGSSISTPSQFTGWQMEGFNPQRTNRSAVGGPATLPTFQAIATNISGSLRRIGPDGSLIVTDLDTVRSYSPAGQLTWIAQVPNLVDVAIASFGRVYVSTPGSVLALDRQTGSTVWTYTANTGNLSWPLAIGSDDVIYFHSGGTFVGVPNRLSAINPNGTKKWEIDVGGQDRPVLSNDEFLAYLNINNPSGFGGTVLAINTSNGQTFLASNSCDARGGVYAFSPAGLLYTGEYNGNLQSFPQDLQTCAFVATNNDPVGRIVTFSNSGNIIVERYFSLGSIYFGTTPQGSRVWTTTDEFSKGIADNTGIIYTTIANTNTAEKAVVAVDTATGNELWRNSFPNEISGMFLGTDGSLYLTSGTSLIKSTSTTPTPTPTPTPSCSPLSITTQPQTQAVFVNQTANLSISAIGTAPLTYQWYKGAAGDTRSPISGATANSYTTAASAAFDRSRYWVRIHDGCSNILDSNEALIVTTDKRPLIFLPGIAGSVLKEGSTELWPGSLAGFPTCLSLPDLTLDPKQSQHAVIATDVVPQVGLKHFYDHLLPYMTSSSGAGYHVSGDNQTMFLVPYDWRKTNGTNDPNDGAAGALKAQIAFVLNKFPGMKVDILAHSMGGMVAQRYIMNQAGANQDPHVNKVITVGTPWLGAPKAINVLETGQFLPVDLCFGYIKELSQWFPGMHELITSTAYYAEVDDKHKPLVEQGWDIDGDGNAFEQYDYTNLVTMLDRRYPDKPGLNNLTFHNLTGQDNGSTAPQDISYYHVYGQEIDSDRTIGRLVAKQHCLLIGSRCVGLRYLDKEFTKGDGTVPAVSASREGVGPALNEPKHALYRYCGSESKVDHVNLCSNSEVLSNVKSILDPTNTGLSSSLADQSFGCGGSAQRHTTREQNLPASGEAYYLRIIGNPVITVSDSLGNTGTLTAASFGLEVPGVTPYVLGDNAFLLVLTPGPLYDITLQTGSTPITVNLTQGTADATTQAIRYSDILLPPNVTLKLAFTTVGPEPLKYDIDHDGTFSGTISPTASVTGTAAQDTEPPVVTIAEDSQSQNVTVVTIAATDSGSGIKKINYSLDGTNYQTYSAPFSVDPYRVRKIYTFADDNVANRSGVLEFQLTAPPPLVMVEQGTTNRAVALDSVTWLRSPFPILTNYNFSADRHTRVILFISGVLLNRSDASIVTVTASPFPLQVENVGTVAGVPGLNASYIVVRLPDGLPFGDLPLTVAVGGVVNTNSVTLGISP